MSHIGKWIKKIKRTAIEIPVDEMKKEQKKGLALGLLLYAEAWIMGILSFGYMYWRWYHWGLWFGLFAILLFMVSFLNL